MTWAAAAVIAAVSTLTVYLQTQIGGSRHGDLFLFTAVVPGPLIVGLLISLRRPGNLVGLFLLGHALLSALTGLADPYAEYGLIDHPGTLPAAR